MDKILFINSCVRENSRTLELAKYVLNKLKGEINEVNLYNENLKPVDRDMLLKRDELIISENFSDTMFNYARDFANSDIIVVAAPYWDLSFPSILKVYFEHITVCGVTFCYENCIPKGLCKAKKLIYVTTAGGYIYKNLGFDYVKALSIDLYGINNALLFKAEGLDIEGFDVDSILKKAKEEIDKILK
ncbi:MAG: NAD(P)H-dependent oxidoreductase [Lachnospirales bacterium]